MKPILKKGRNVWRRARTDRAGLLIDGRDYYRALRETARRSRRFVCIAGWQLDSRVRLLRGDDATSAGGEAPLLEFLEECCRRCESLQVYILAWDFSVLYSLERESLQEIRFGWTSHERVHFHFDSVHPVGASHHHKFVVADDAVAFVGGMDVCADRWDRPQHEETCPERVNPRGKTYGPYHDVQAMVLGPAARAVTRSFRERWHRATGKALRLPRGESLDPAELEATLSIESRKVAFSRTVGKMISPPVEPVEEVRALYRDAIRRARSLIYMENQYFTSQAVVSALRERMTDRGLPSLEVVLILPPDPGNMLERLALMALQSRYVESLGRLAREHGHQFGVYCVSAGDDWVYIHSKVMIVDDRLLTVGTANTTNRSMGLDSEINLTWETTDPDDALGRSLARARVALMGHLAGLPESEHEGLRRHGEIVSSLDRGAGDGSLRLRPYADVTADTRDSSLVQLLPDGFHLDPEHSPMDERFWENQTWKRR